MFKAKVVSGYRNLAYILSGFRASEVTVIAAGPGVGKTKFAISLTLNISREKKAKVLFFSLEMSSKHIMMRMLSNISEVNTNNVSGEIISDSEVKSIV